MVPHKMLGRFSLHDSSALGLVVDSGDKDACIIVLIVDVHSGQETIV